MSVFLSYTHDSDDHRARIRALALGLRARGVEVVVDQDFETGGPHNGWDKWSELQASRAERVIIVITESYRRCWDGEQPSGMRLGATHEAAILARRVYEAGPSIDFLRVAFFTEADREQVPLRLRGLQLFHGEHDQPALAKWLGDKGESDRPRVEWTAQLATYIWPLADRVTEFAQVRLSLSGASDKRILLVGGGQECGKTTFLRETLKYATALGVANAYVDLEDGPTFDELLASLRVELGSHLFKGVVSGGKTGLYQFLLNVQEQERPLVLALDSYEHARLEVRTWIEGHLLRLERAPGLIAIVGGRELPRSRAYDWSIRATQVELGAIQQAKDWVDYAGRAGLQLSDDAIAVLTRAARGDPGLVKHLLENMAADTSASAEVGSP